MSSKATITAALNNPEGFETNHYHRPLEMETILSQNRHRLLTRSACGLKIMTTHRFGFETVFGKIGASFSFISHFLPRIPRSLCLGLQNVCLQPFPPSRKNIKLISSRFGRTLPLVAYIFFLLWILLSAKIIVIGRNSRWGETGSLKNRSECTEKAISGIFASKFVSFFCPQNEQ
jgi:hypothetical protein